MSEWTTVDISPVIDEQGFRLITVRVFVLCFMAMLAEGYDLGVVGYAAPGVLRSFGIVRAAFAPVFSVALFGMLLGALAAGALGDRFGRKKGIAVALGITCLGSFGSAHSLTLSQLLWSRFVVGVGLGGVLPNVTALLAEYLPRRRRGTFTTYAFMGITAGGVLPSFVTDALGADDWRALFLIGSLVPLFCVPLVAMLLPESLKFLALRGRHDGELRRRLREIDPDLPLPPDARFRIDEDRVEGSAFAGILSGRLRIMTPALWICFIAIMMANFFINSWLTVLLRDFGFQHHDAARAASLYYVGGVTGGLLIGVLLDRLGAMTLSMVALLGSVFIFLLGAARHSHAVDEAVIFLIGATVLGGQVGTSSLAGLLYQTSVRSRGVGLAHSIGRIGAIGGPLVAGVMMTRDASLAALLALPALAMLSASASLAVITWTWTGRVLGLGFDTLQPGRDELPRPGTS